MAKVRFLTSAYLPLFNKVVGYNDEMTIEDEKVVEILSKKGMIDVLIEEEIAPKPAKKAKKKGE
jgi:adenine-specific DNA methylase